MKRRVFYSFHFDEDCRRAQQVRNMGAFEGNEPVSANDWETIRRNPAAVERWIDQQLQGRTCCVVLVGNKTATRPWVIHEIQTAWNKGLGVVGVRIDQLKDPVNGTSLPGPNPFEKAWVGSTRMDLVAQLHNPLSILGAYTTIQSSLDRWVESAIAIRNRYH